MRMLVPQGGCCRVTATGSKPYTHNSGSPRIVLHSVYDTTDVTNLALPFERNKQAGVCRLPARGLSAQKQKQQSPIQAASMLSNPAVNYSDDARLLLPATGSSSATRRNAQRGCVCLQQCANAQLICGERDCCCWCRLHDAWKRPLVQTPYACTACSTLILRCMATTQTKHKHTTRTAANQTAALCAGEVHPPCARCSTGSQAEF
jgi:hypothetical protein